MSSLQTGQVKFVRHDRPWRQSQAGAANLVARLAVSPASRADAYRIRHESYVSGGYIDPNAEGVFHDHYDDLPNAQTIVIYRRERPVASVRVCVLDTDPALTGWDKVPASAIFPEDIDALIAKVPEKTGNVGFARAIEINRLVRHPDFAQDHELVFALFRLATFMVQFYRTDFMMSCVRPNHSGFYRRMHFHKVAGPRRYAGVKFETNLAACFRDEYDEVLRDVPVVDSGAMTNGCYDGLFRGEAVPVFAGP